MLTAAELAGMALDVLPEAPCRVVCLRDDGAKTELRVLGTSGTARLQAELPVIDAREGGEILIKVERGCFRLALIGC